jgi:hypothetical protein
VARVNVEYQLNMMSKSNEQYIYNGKMAIPFYVESEENIIEKIHEHILKESKNLEGEVASGIINAELLGKNYEMEFTVIEDKGDKWKRFVAGTDTIQ